MGNIKSAVINYVTLIYTNTYFITPMVADILGDREYLWITF